MRELESGFTFDPYAGATYHFEHMPLAAAEELARTAESSHVVETINWTESEGGSVHYNRYFAHDFDDALALAVKLRMGLEEEAEEVVSIRPATTAEAAQGHETSTRFLSLMPEAVSDKKVKKTSKKKGRNK